MSLMTSNVVPVKKKKDILSVHEKAQKVLVTHS